MFPPEDPGLSLEQGTFAPLLELDLAGIGLLERVGRQEAESRAMFRSVQALTTTCIIRPRLRHPPSDSREPVVPRLAVRVFGVDRQQQCATIQQVLAAPAERVEVLVPASGQAKGIAHVDRPIPARQVERCHGLGKQPRRHARRRQGPLALRKHVARDVAAVDVDARPRERNEEAAGPAREVENRLAVPLDLTLEERQLRRTGQDLAPPLRHQAVVPHDRLVGIVGRGGLVGMAAYVVAPWLVTSVDGLLVARLQTNQANSAASRPLRRLRTRIGSAS